MEYSVYKKIHSGICQVYESEQEDDFSASELSFILSSLADLLEDAYEYDGEGDDGEGERVPVTELKVVGGKTT